MSGRNRLTNKLRNKKGETFLEVLAALLVIGFGILMLLGATGVSRRAYKIGDSRVTELYREISDANAALQAAGYTNFTTDYTVTYSDTGVAGSENRKLRSTDNGFVVFK